MTRRGRPPRSASRRRSADPPPPCGHPGPPAPRRRGPGPGSHIRFQEGSPVATSTTKALAGDEPPSPSPRTGGERRPPAAAHCCTGWTSRAPVRVRRTVLRGLRRVQFLPARVHLVDLPARRGTGHPRCHGVGGVRQLRRTLGRLPVLERAAEHHHHRRHLHGAAADDGARPGPPAQLPDAGLAVLPRRLAGPSTPPRWRRPPSCSP